MAKPSPFYSEGKGTTVLPTDIEGPLPVGGMPSVQATPTGPSTRELEEWYNTLRESLDGLDNVPELEDLCDAIYRYLH